MTCYKQLAAPVKINGVLIKNRIVVPPMADFGMTEQDGYINERHLRHYGALSEGGAGLIIIEACAVSKMKEPRNTIGLYDDKFMPGLEKLANEAGKKEAAVLVQLLNSGLDIMSEDRISDISRNDFLQYKADFISAAIRCKKAGFDGVELHAAHGFYLNQVMETSMRNDEYGGPLGNRLRLLQELIEEIKSICGEKFLVAVRFGNRNLQELVYIAKVIENTRGDILDISTGMFTYGNSPADFPYDRKIFAASLVKQNVGIPVIGVGGIQTGEQAEKILEDGCVDMIAVGRGHLCNPDWAERVFRGVAVHLCRHCGTCLWYIDGRKCPVVKSRNC